MRSAADVAVRAVPMVDGEEFDMLTRLGRAYCKRAPGRAKAAKRKYRRRLRSRVRMALRQREW